MCPAIPENIPAAGEAALAACQATALHNTAHLVAAVLPLQSEGLGCWMVQQRIQNQSVTCSVSHALPTQCPSITEVGKIQLFVSWDNLLKASPLCWHVLARPKALKSGDVLSSYKRIDPFPCSWPVCEGRQKSPHQAGHGALHFVIQGLCFSYSPPERQRGVCGELSHRLEDWVLGLGFSIPSHLMGCGF